MKFQDPYIRDFSRGGEHNEPPPVYRDKVGKPVIQRDEKLVIDSPVTLMQPTDGPTEPSN